MTPPEFIPDGDHLTATPSMQSLTESDAAVLAALPSTAPDLVSDEHGSMLNVVDALERLRSRGLARRRVTSARGLVRSALVWERTPGGEERTRRR